MRLIPRRPNRALARDIETPQLWLRTMGPVRAVLLVAPWHRDAELMAGLALHSAPMPLLRWLGRFQRPNNVTRFAYAIVPKSMRRPVGYIAMGLGPDKIARSHVAISDAAWRGRQISVEARAALIDLFFAAGAECFEARVPGRNAASIFVYRKLGFRLVATELHESVDTATGRPVDRTCLMLTRDDWDARAAAANPIAQGASR